MENKKYKTGKLREKRRMRRGGEMGWKRRERQQMLGSGGSVAGQNLREEWCKWDKRFQMWFGMEKLRIKR